MSLFHALASSFEAAMLYLAVVTSRFEAETLNVPPALRFFTTGADPDQLSRQAFLFALAPVHAFISILILNALQGAHSHGLLRYAWFYLRLLTLFWLAIVIVRALDILEGRH